MEKKDQHQTQQQHTQGQPQPQPKVHYLNDSWVFWYSPRAQKIHSEKEEYLDVLTNLGECSTVEEFFSYYCYLKKPSETEVDNKLMFFRKNCKPCWEEWMKGGCWILQYKPTENHLLDEHWQRIMFACIGEQFSDTSIIGIVLSLKKKVNLIEIWLSKNKENFKIQVGEHLREILHLEHPENLKFSFKDNYRALKDGSVLKNSEGYSFTPVSTQTPGQNQLDDSPTQIKNKQSNNKEQQKK